MVFTQRSKIRGDFNLEPEILEDNSNSNQAIESFEEFERAAAGTLADMHRAVRTSPITVNASSDDGNEFLKLRSRKRKLREIKTAAKREATEFTTPVKVQPKRARVEPARTIVVEYETDDDVEKEFYFRKTPEFKTRAERIRYNTRRKLWRAMKKFEIEDRQAAKENPLIITLNHSPGCCEKYNRSKRRWEIKHDLECDIPYF